jgi:hypothetical protein
MNLELYLQNSNDGTVYDISELATTIQVKKDIEGNAGKLTVLLQKDPRNLLKIANGSIISFIADRVGIFFGYVFTIGTDATQTYKITAYDQLRYLKNEEVYVTQNMSASYIFEKICMDNQLRYQVKVPSNYIPSAYLHDKKTLYEIINRGRKLANIYENKQYYVTDEFGTLTWSELSYEKTNLIIGEQSLLTSYQYEKSIDSDTYNQIKIYRDNSTTGKRDVWIAKDSNNIKRWGKLQLLEKADENDTSTMIQETIQNYLKVKNRETQTLKLNALGVNELTAGKGFKFILDRENISQDMWIISSTHNYNKDTHTMELEVYI